jgi:hypothetical protein
MAHSQTTTSFALCIDDTECDDLELRKVYRVIPDGEARKEGYLRVIDESGEDYLYPASCFIPLELPLTAHKAFSKLPGPV